MPETQVLLFPFNRCRRLTRYIIHDAVNPPNLINNSAGYYPQNVIGNVAKISGHKIGGLDRPNSQ